jgi:hypothetical protein
MSHTAFTESLLQPQQIVGHGGEGADFLLVQRDDTSHHALLVNIQSTTFRVHYFHRVLHNKATSRRAARLLLDFTPRALPRMRHSLWCLQAAGSDSFFGLVAPDTNRTPVTYRCIAIFILRGDYSK